MGDRITDGRCIKCGFALIDLNSYFCTQCQKEVQAEVRAKVQSRKETGNKKRIKMNIGMLGVTQRIKKA